MSSIRKASTKILFLSEVTEVQLTANLLVIILPIAVNYFLTGAMASSFHAGFCTKPYKGVSGTQSYIQDGAFRKKLTALSIFAKKLGVWLRSKYAVFRESLQKCNF